MAEITATRPTSFEQAAALVRERVLVRGTSLSRARERLWREPHLGELTQRLRAAAERSEGTLEQRWDAALEGAAPPVVSLAAEALAVHLLIAADISAETKRRQIQRTLERTDAPAALPRVIDEALAHGVTPTGIAFKRRRLSQLVFLLTAVSRWRSLPAGERRAALEDPWQLRDWLRSLPADGAQAQREALLHLIHPDSFEPILSLGAKRRIVAALGRVSERALDTDEALLAIRSRLKPRHGEGFSFAAPPLRDSWLP